MKQPEREVTVTGRRSFIWVVAILILAVVQSPGAAQTPDLADQVEVLRTNYGVPHIVADNLRAAFFAMGYVQTEDYGVRVPRGLIQARGHLSRTFGPDSLGLDVYFTVSHQRAEEAFELLDPDVRDVYEGFALGVSRYVELHPDQFPEYVHTRFTGVDVLARGIGRASTRAMGRFARRLENQTGGGGLEIDPDAAERLFDAVDPEDGSNAWALHPTRTSSGKAILLRNPHLSWDAGYYEAQVTVPGVLDYYGDYRVGSPFGIIGGFNAHLGWATTNNAPDLDEVYALDADPEREDRVLFEGDSHPIERREIEVEVLEDGQLVTRTEVELHTLLGRVIHRAEGKVYVFRQVGDGEYRVGQQFLRMMQAQNLEEWKEAMRMQAKTTSNFTYADADGNIFYVWNGAVPIIPHPPGYDSIPVPAKGWADVWREVTRFDDLPQLLNPPGGYLHNENSPFHFANLNQPFSADDFPPNFPEPGLSLRSQLSLQLIGQGKVVSLEDVVRLKHSMRILTADRWKADLVAAVRAAGPNQDVAAAADLLERWDNTVSRESVGSVLFDIWMRRYSVAVPDRGSRWAVPWSAAEPVSTPRGVGRPVEAVEAFGWAVDETVRRHGRVDVPWGEVHRVRRGEVDVPVGGCAGGLGCFRALVYEPTEDGKQVAVAGDAWVLAIEFTDPPRAYSVLAYGQSSLPDSPHHADQAGMFAENRMKAVVFTPEDVEAQLIRRYRPGREPRP